MSGMVAKDDRAVIAICKHICSRKALSGAAIAIRIDKPTICRIVVSALQVVESCLGVVVVASVAEGVEVSYAVGAGNGGAGVVGDGQELLPWVSGIRESEELPYALTRSVSVGQSPFYMERKSKCKGGYAMTPSPYMNRH